MHPSIFGIGDGAEFFGVRKVHFLFHDTTALALGRLAHLEEVVPDISKWRFRDTEGGGSASYCDGKPETVRAEAEKVSRFSRAFPIFTAPILTNERPMTKVRRRGEAPVSMTPAERKSHLKTARVIYSHELEPPGSGSPSAYMDVVTFWVWGYERLMTLEEDLKRCRGLFGDRPILMGCYLRDYPTAAPMPMESVRHQWEALAKALADGLVDGYDILATVLIEGQLEQAEWIRDFIKDHS